MSTNRAVAVRASSHRSLIRCCGTSDARHPEKPIRPLAWRGRVSGGGRRECVEAGSGPVIETLQVGVAHELQEVLIAPDVTGQEAEVKDAPSLVAAALLVQPGALGEIELAANQRLDPLALRGRVEINGAKEVAMVGEGERRHPELARPVGQPVDPARAV